MGKYGKALNCASDIVNIGTVAALYHLLFFLSFSSVSSISSSMPYCPFVPKAGSTTCLQRQKPRQRDSFAQGQERGRLSFVAVQLLRCVRLFAIPRTTAHHVPLSMGLPRQEYQSGLMFPSPGDPSDSWIKPASPVLARGFFTISHQGSPFLSCHTII